MSNGCGDESTLSVKGANVMAEYYQLSSTEQRKVADLIFASCRGFNVPMFSTPPPMPTYLPFVQQPAPQRLLLSSPQATTTTTTNAWSDAPIEVFQQIKQPPPPPQPDNDGDGNGSNYKYARVCDKPKCRCRYYFTKKEMENGAATPELNALGVMVFKVVHPDNADDMNDKQLSRWVYGHVAGALDTRNTHINVERLWVHANRREVDVYFDTHADAVKGMLRLRKQGFSVNWMRQRAAMPSLHAEEEGGEAMEN